MTFNRLEREIDELFTRWDRKKTPGCAVGIIKNSTFLYKKGYGMANLDYDIPITPKTVFRIGSTSKQFTAFSMALLAQQGKLSLDDDICNYVPEMPKYKKPITIRHLIHHSSGIRDVYNLYEMKGLDFVEYDILDYEDFLNIITRQKNLDFSPGKAFSYSNSGYILLSMIVERVSRIPLSKFAEENIFKPLGMKNTHFHDDRTMIVKNRAIGYSQAGESEYKINESIINITGDGALFTTIEDFLFWDNNFYNPIVGNNDLITQTITPGLLDNKKMAKGDGKAYAFGLRVGKYRGLKIIEHSGGWAGFRSHMLRFPDQRFTVLCFSNLAEFVPGDFTLKIANLYLKKEFPPEEKDEIAQKMGIIESTPTIDLPETEIKKFTGFYTSDKLPVIIKAYLESGHLEFNVNDGMYVFTLAPINQNRFKSIQGPFTLQCDFIPSYDPALFNAKAYLPEPFGEQEFRGLKSLTYSEEQLKEYEGIYYSDELDCTYYFAVEKCQLYLTIKKKIPEPIFSSEKDQFWASKLGISIIFQRDQNKIITGFIANSSRAKKVLFYRT